MIKLGFRTQVEFCNSKFSEVFNKLGFRTQVDFSIIAQLRPWHQPSRARVSPIFTWRLYVRMSVPYLSFACCLGAQLDSVTDRRTDRHTDRQTDIQTPGENSANSSPAGLVPGPELSNYGANVGTAVNSCHQLSTAGDSCKIFLLH